MVEEIIAAGAPVIAALGAAVGLARRTRHPLMLQWGRFQNQRPGLQEHPYFADEPDVVEFEDFKWWVRVRPNPGINLPVIGYWSKARGRRINGPVR